MCNYKKLLSCLFILAATGTYAQSVGINTATPDASAALEIKSTTKGLLIPQVNLLSTVDMITIPSPATSLMVYNTNAALPGGAGYYFNNGTSSAPDWKNIGGLILPYSKTQSSITPLFSVTNNGLGYSGEFISTNTGAAAALKVSTSANLFSSSAIHGTNGSSTLTTSSKKAILGESSGSGIGVAGLSQYGYGLYGESILSIGVIGKSAGGYAGYFVSDSGTALVTSGEVVMLNTGAAAGKMLMTNSSGTAQWQGAIAFSAKYDSAQVPLPLNTSVTVPFNHEVFDISNNFTKLGAIINPNNFIAPVSGVYHFDASVELIGESHSELIFKFLINSVAQGGEWAMIHPDFLAYSAHSGQTFKLNAGDKVRVSILSLSNSTCTIAGAKFSGHLLFLQ